MFIVNVEGAIHLDGKWLMIRRSKKEEHAGGLLSLVGGTCEQEGNSADILERTLHREVFEEIGVEVENLKYVNSSSFVSDSGRHVVDIVFLCHHKSGTPYAKSTEEVDEVVWMTTSEILNHEEIPRFLKENIKLAERVLHEMQMK
ncbi:MULTISPECIES: NUDIX hydrolase [Bacillaceae]|uniref:NUDIX domain-containing protein n=1 Tax=Evansella alkalicola TaxID=745819 RepID=A0ABS6JZU3_9BACI|nr:MULTISPECIES: NUDIX domain-containing protein [Bacillaceae]MBU9722727.1 NUDIX domain-containing protein [Bacillus alkalicola]